jgi:hypothetical protein
VGTKIFFGKSEIRLDTPVDTPPDGQINGPRRFNKLHHFRRVGKGALAPCPPFLRIVVGTLRFAHPTVLREATEMQSSPNG